MNPQDKKPQRKHILDADFVGEDKTPKQITCGLRTELSGYDGFYLTEENAIAAIRLYNTWYTTYLKNKIKQLEEQIHEK